ncbi:MAG: tRNA (adenosine(37)-N6)-threonylcarbamoyltransferase complex dimerization subunit type 1 TsaB [Gammaproteobacteria bacterium]
MKLLALDTATEACSAALYIDGEISQRYQLAPREHSNLILQMLDDLLAEASITLPMLDALAFGRGPGSFMGLRIAAGVVQGISLAHELPVVPVSTLASIAQIQMQQPGVEKVLAAIDARMSEVYWGAYQNNEGQPVLQGEEMVVPPGQVPVPEGSDWHGAGSGWGSFADALKQRLGACVSDTQAECFPSAASIATLAVPMFAQGGGVDAAQAIPVYLRDKVAKKAASR